MVEGGSGQSVHATARRRGILTIATLVAAVAAACVQPASAGSACADAVLEEWTEGTLGSTYSPDCYEAAIDALPEDLRAYTTAADDISRAAITASRKAPARELTSSTAEPASVRSFPQAVIVLAVAVGLLAATGLTASLYRRRRAR
jgi:hypothetical protein